MTGYNFLRTLQTYKSDNVFNPYSDVCPLYDHPKSPTIRLNNLHKLIDSFQSCKVDSIWLGRDLGHKGGRRTGIALTDEVNLPNASQIWNVELEKSTTGNPFSEITAKTIWNAISRIDAKIFTWNIFPFHPYESGNHYSNRPHAAKEQKVGVEILIGLIDILKPVQIVAVGNDAYSVSCKIFSDMNIFKVRHPSYGGIKLFSEQTHKLYA